MDYSAYKPKKKEKNPVPPFFRVVFVASGLLIGFLLSKIFLFSMKVNDDSMLPNLEKGDMCFGIKYQKPVKDNIVIVESLINKGEYSIKRVIAVPGETVEIKNRQIIVNGSIIQSQYKLKMDDPRFFSPEFTSRDNMSKILLSADQYFVVGDNRDKSFDSRNYGPVNIKKIKSKVILNF